MSIPNKAKQYFELEKLRREHAKNGRIKELLSTYNSPIIIPDFNSGSFWDSKFKHEAVGVGRFPMEISRNITANNWYRTLYAQGYQNTINFGCGNGKFEKLLSSFQKINHVGVDNAPETIDQLKAAFPRFSFYRSDLIKDQFHQGAYDVGFLFEVLEHIPPSRAQYLLKKIRKTLRKDGYLMISVPMNEGLEETYPSNPNGHLRCYSEHLLFAELELSGYEIIRSRVFYAFDRFYGIKNFIARWILKNKWLPNNILVLARKK